jgi:hypothetical protein
VRSLRRHPRAFASHAPPSPRSLFNTPRRTPPTPCMMLASLSSPATFTAMAAGGVRQPRRRAAGEQNQKDVEGGGMIRGSRRLMLGAPLAAAALALARPALATDIASYLAGAYNRSLDEPQLAVFSPAYH